MDSNAFGSALCSFFLIFLVATSKCADTNEVDEVILSGSAFADVKEGPIDFASHLSPGAVVERVVSECPCIVFKKNEDTGRFFISSAPKGLFRQKIVVGFSENGDRDVKYRRMEISGWNGSGDILEVRFLGPPSVTADNRVILTLVVITPANESDDISIGQTGAVTKVAVIKCTQDFSGINKLYRWIFAVELDGDQPIQIPIKWRRNSEISEETVSYAPRTIHRKWK